ncbi:putative 7-dehydrocholesterol reductase [Helianthus anomalus]
MVTEEAESMKKKKKEEMVHSPILTYLSVITLLSTCPPFVILLWYTMVHQDGSMLNTFNYLKEHGVEEGFVNIRPTATYRCCMEHHCLLCTFRSCTPALVYLGKELRAQCLPLAISPSIRYQTLS